MLPNNCPLTVWADLELEQQLREGLKTESDKTFLKNKSVAEETVSAIMNGISKISYKRQKDKVSAKAQTQEVDLES